MISKPHSQTQWAEINLQGLVPLSDEGAQLGSKPPGSHIIFQKYSSYEITIFRLREQLTE